MNNIVLISILLLGALVYFYKIDQLMPFIGDQGWFYLSARDMVMNGTIPYVGIASSHPWLHQGAFWTYLLAPTLWLFNFNPVSGAYLAGLFHLGTVYLLFKFGKSIFNVRVGIIAALLYLASPLVVIYGRMPYHTSPIPFFSLLLLYTIIQWMRGKTHYFPWIICLLVVLYNFQISTSIFTFVVGCLFVAGLYLKKKWARGIFTRKILMYSFIAFFIPILPMLIYDTSNGFPQTAGFVAWTIYKVLVIFGYPPLHEHQSSDTLAMVRFVSESYTRLIFPLSSIVAGIIFIATTCMGLKYLYDMYKKKKVEYPIFIIILFNVIGVIGLLATNVPSDAYLPMLFAGIILFIAICFDRLAMVLTYKGIAYVAVFAIVITNIYYMVSHNYYFAASGPAFSLQKRIDVVKEIIRTSDGKGYTIKGKGNGSQFESFLMNYKYLAWWLGHAPSDKRESLHFTIVEEKDRIHVNLNKQKK